MQKHNRYKSAAVNHHKNIRSYFDPEIQMLLLRKSIWNVTKEEWGCNDDGLHLSRAIMCLGKVIWLRGKNVKNNTDHTHLQYWISSDNPMKCHCQEKSKIYHAQENVTNDHRLSSCVWFEGLFLIYAVAAMQFWCLILS